MTETIFKIENLKTTAFAEEVEVSVSIISILLTVTEKLLIKSSSKETLT